MNTQRRILQFGLLLGMVWAAPLVPAADALKLHGVFSSHMVLQRDKPVVIWGWAPESSAVQVVLGGDAVVAAADGRDGRWQVEFPARPASAEPLKLVVTAGGEVVELEDIVVGDVWVMNGQSNMAWPLGKTQQADLATLQAHLPLLRCLSIQPNEQAELQVDIPAEKLDNGGWTVATPETVGGFTAIGYHFGSRVQQALQVPIGIIKNARGGASIESMVPIHKFDDDPLAKRYAESVAKRRAAFDPDEEVARQVRKWEGKIKQLREKGTPDHKLPPKPTRDSLRSWNIPGMSPSDAASCYNGMFGAFKGLNIKGVLFHQGYNNAMSSTCRPKRYRVLMRLMVEGWREDFNDPQLPVGVIGFCAGGIAQTDEDFELWSVAPAAYIREAQRLGLQDAGVPEFSAYLSGDDVQIPGLHPQKKQAHGVRAARWALKAVYGQKVAWDSASLVSSEVQGDEVVLTFDKPVFPDNQSMVPEGFSVAGEDGKFYRAHARFRMKKDAGIWNTPQKSCDASIIHVWSPLVKQPVAVRYSWATSPLGNLKANGKPWAPLANFRTDAWDWPESDDPEEQLVTRGTMKELNGEAAERCEFRKLKEAEMAVGVLERLKALGRP